MELFNPGAERAVLAALLQYNSEAFVEIQDIISEGSFGEANNQVIFKCIRHILENEQTVDLPSILSSAEQLNLSHIIHTDQEIKYIKSLQEFLVNRENVYKFALQVKKYEFARNIKTTANGIIDRVSNITGEESVDQIISYLEDPVINFLREEEHGERPEILGEDVFEYLQFLEDNSCDMLGIPTGFPRWDEAIGGGLRRKCVDVLSARPKVGKSMFADGAALNITRSGIPVLMLDTEMDNNDHINRLLANIAGVKTKQIETGQFGKNPSEKKQLHAAAQELASLPYHYINISGRPTESVFNIIKRWIMHTVGTDEEGRTNDCVVIYDYLKLTDSSDITNNIQEYQALGFQIQSLHNLSVKLDFPCLAFVQLNRDGISKEDASAVSGSDRIIWLCTSFSMFKRKTPEEIASDGPDGGNRKLIPIEMRHGGGLPDGDYINLLMEGDEGRLTELNTRNYLANRGDKDTGLLNKEDVDAINGRPKEAQEDNS